MKNNITKRVLAGISALMILPVSNLTTVENAEAVHFIELGDTDFNGSVDSLDALNVLNYVVGNNTDVANGDMDSDGVITSKDALYILQRTAGLEIPTQLDFEFEEFKNTPLTQHIREQEDFDYLNFLYYDTKDDGSYYYLNCDADLWVVSSTEETDNSVDIIMSKFKVNPDYEGYISTGVKMGDTLEDIRVATGYTNLTAFNNYVYYTEEGLDGNVLCALKLDDNQTAIGAYLFECYPENGDIYSKTPASTMPELFSSAPSDILPRYSIESGLGLDKEELYFSNTSLTLEAYHNTNDPGHYIIPAIDGFEYPIIYVNQGSVTLSNYTYTIGDCMLERIKEVFGFPADENLKQVTDRLLSEDPYNPDIDSDLYTYELCGLIILDPANDLAIQLAYGNDFILKEIAVSKNTVPNLLFSDEQLPSVEPVE